MCAPCKIIVDSGASSRAYGGGPGEVFGAMAESAAEVLRDPELRKELKPKVLAALMDTDVLFLRGKINAADAVEAYIEALTS